MTASASSWRPKKPSHKFYPDDIEIGHWLRNCSALHMRIHIAPIVKLLMIQCLTGYEKENGYGMQPLV